MSGILVFRPEHLRPAPRKPRARFSEGKVKRWYANWVKRWEGAAKHPSLEDDREAAQDELGFEITRAFMRSVRCELAPEHWKKPGRRRKSGSTE